jgi:hypothetical protein
MTALNPYECVSYKVPDKDVCSVLLDLRGRLSLIFQYLLLGLGFRRSRDVESLVLLLSRQHQAWPPTLIGAHVRRDAF